MILKPFSLRTLFTDIKMCQLLYYWQKYRRGICLACFILYNTNASFALLRYLLWGYSDASYGLLRCLLRVVAKSPVTRRNIFFTPIADTATPVSRYQNMRQQALTYDLASISHRFSCQEPQGCESELYALIMLIMVNIMQGFRNLQFTEQ